MKMKHVGLLNRAAPISAEQSGSAQAEFLGFAAEVYANKITLAPHHVSGSHISIRYIYQIKLIRQLHS